MSKNFEKVLRVGISDKCVCEAIESVVKEANEEAQVSWFEVKETRGRLTSEGKLEYQVTVELGRKLK